MPTIIALGGKFGMSEAAVRACLQKPENMARNEEVNELAAADGASSTPTLIVNGVRIDTPGKTVDETWAAAKAAIDAELAK